MLVCVCKECNIHYHIHIEVNLKLEGLYVNIINIPMYNICIRMYILHIYTYTYTEHLTHFCFIMYCL